MLNILQITNYILIQYIYIYIGIGICIIVSMVVIKHT